MLTKFLGDALVGNSLTTVLIAASKKPEAVAESVKSMCFGQNAGLVKTRAVLDVTQSVEEMKAEIEKLRQELTACKAQLAKAGISPPSIKNKTLVDPKNVTFSTPLTLKLRKCENFASGLKPPSGKDKLSIEIPDEKENEDSHWKFLWTKVTGQLEQERVKLE